MKRRLKFVITAFSISFLLMVALSFYSLERLDKFIEYSDQVDHTNDVLRNLYKIEGYIKDLDRGERGYMLTYDSSYSHFIFRIIDSLPPVLKELKEKTLDSKVQQDNLVLTRSIIVMRVGLLRQNMAYIDSNHTHEPSDFYYNGRKEMVACMKKLREMHSQENKIFADRVSNQQFYQQLTTNALNMLLVIFFVLTILLFIVIMRELKKRVAFQEELQSKVHDLKRSHSELEQIAYAASHDMQEPLRKIQVFANRLVWMKKGNLDEDTRMTLEKVNTSANRMQHLIEDLVSLTSLIKEDNKKEQVDVMRPLKMALEDLDEKITGCHAIVTVDNLPQLKAYSDQLIILFKSLLDNSLKFCRENVPPVIRISSSLVNGDELMDVNKSLTNKKFHRIIIEDNGIGFDNKFSPKMFQIFQRLHNQHSKYDGIGIGLAICQRIMTNHDGYILAHGHTEVGATFKLFFPVEE